MTGTMRPAFIGLPLHRTYARSRKQLCILETSFANCEQNICSTLLSVPKMASRAVVREEPLSRKCENERLIITNFAKPLAEILHFPSCPGRQDNCGKFERAPLPHRNMRGCQRRQYGKVYSVRTSR